MLPHPAGGRHGGAAAAAADTGATRGWKPRSRFAAHVRGPALPTRGTPPHTPPHSTPALF